MYVGGEGCNNESRVVISPSTFKYVGVLRDACDTVVACSTRGWYSNWILNEFVQAALVLLFTSSDVIMKRKRRPGERLVL